jgi:CRISPR-associated exonuclease Cas4
MIIYITSDREEFTFSLTRDKKMFEEVIRRVRVLSDLLIEQKTPILEPSINCLNCQYYQRCFISKKNSKQFDLAEILGLSKEN